MTPAQALILATLLPLISFGILIFFGKKMGRISAWIATAAILGALALSLTAALTWVDKHYNLPHHAEAINVRWLPLPSANAFENTAAPRSLNNTFGSAFLVGVVVDSLTIIMFIMVSIVASVVHIFSMAYMSEDPRYSRFFAYLGLFCFSMFGLVLSNSLLQMFVFWELVGACSFLLIGFWFEKKGPALASKKAMVVNRIGDASFLIGVGILLMHIGPAGLTLVESTNVETGTSISVLAQSVDNSIRGEITRAPGNSDLQHFAQLSAIEGAASHSYLTHNFGATFLGLSWLTWAGICIFGGAIAKSAQFPLHVWLPDAMEGPTPVSALIHAATMVAAGVYLVARVYPILTMDARLFIAIIGCITALLGALIALVQTDLKKVLAYSTISQLGLMILFLGAGGYVAGLYHLITHAFFKACLFLGAGSVIYAMHHEQDMRQMGGLWKKIPITAATFLVAVLAISGTPYFSGFYSKELGLSAVYLFAQALPGTSSGHHYAMLLYWVPVFASYLTAFYMWRCWWLTFGGKPRNEELHEHAHESPLMTFALIILAVLSVGFWFEFFKVPELLNKSLITAGTLAATSETPLAIPLVNAKPGPVRDAVEHALHYAAQTTFWAFIGGPIFAIAIYFSGFKLADKIRRLPGINLLYTWLNEKMFFDALYEGIVVNFCKIVANTLAFLDKYLVDGLVNLAALLTRLLARVSNIFDLRIVDGLVNGAADSAHFGGRAVLTPQSGRIRVYVLSLFTALALAMVTILVILALG